MAQTIITDVTIGQNVRIMRNARDMTGEELAARCGVGYTKAYRLENGSIKFDIPLLCKIADILDTTPGRLLDGRVADRMIDLTGVPDGAATALELLAQELVRPDPAPDA